MRDQHCHHLFIHYSNLKNFVKIVLKNIVIYSSIVLVSFAIFEVLSRAFFPKLSNNHVHKTISKNHIISKSKNVFKEDYKGLEVRKSFKNYSNLDYEKNAFVVGDSVSGGFGLEYQNTFFSLAEDMINQSFDEKIRFFSIGNYNNNLWDNLDVINENQDKFNDGDYLIFQFNFNDLNFYNFRSYFEQQSEQKKIIFNNSIIEKNQNLIKENFKDYYNETFRTNIFYEIVHFIRINTIKVRREYLNHSTFLRVLQHYAGIIARNKSGNCEDRKLDALGQYTYTFGSKGFENESQVLWELFENHILKINKSAKENNINFIILISPISILIEHQDHINHVGLSIECATIDAHERLLNFFEKENIEYIDPTKKFNEYSINFYNEKNVVNLFHDFDTNHPNLNGSLLIAISILEYFSQKN